MCVLHRYGRWEDVKVNDRVRPGHSAAFCFVREVIVQQRRCRKCNIVKVRRA